MPNKDPVDEKLHDLINAVSRMMQAETIREVNAEHYLCAEATMYIKHRDKVLVEALLMFIKANPNQEVPQAVIELGIIPEVE